MIYIYFKARFRPSVAIEDNNPEKYTFFEDIDKNDKYERRKCIQKLNNIMRHDEHGYDIICLGSQDPGTLDMIVAFKQRTDVVNMKEILDKETEWIWKELQISYDGKNDAGEWKNHIIEVMENTIKRITWQETGNRIFGGHEDDFLSDGYRRVKDYGLEIVVGNRFRNRTGVAVEWNIRKCGLKIDNKDAALKRAARLAVDDSFMAEIDRIYDESNPQKFCGIPVHYQITVENQQVAEQYIDLLVAALYNQKRLLTDEIAHLRLSPKCRRMSSEDVDIVHHITNGFYGGVIVLERDIRDINGTLLRYFEDTVSEHINEKIMESFKNVMFIFYKHKFEETIIEDDLSDDRERMNIVKLSEGYANRATAKEYLKELAATSDFPQYMDDAEFEKVLPVGNQITCSEIYNAFECWNDNVMKNKAFICYKEIMSKSELKIKKHNEMDNDPYVELQEMIGLERAKALVDDILMGQELRILKEARGFTTNRGSHHILFTGNPGSAKTTVARLLAKILYDRRVTTNPRLLECGRGDIIAKYVGHTADKVRKLFEKAEGGVLFIDEAYSLVDDRRGLYGDEAIATIVQEMENMRNKVIVILAGYKQPMEKLLQVNEGLRSRIGFHIDFPDYNADEMTEIIKLMASKQNYVISGKAIQRCHEIFVHACTNEEFGNGRFARNLLEQAILHQARRLLTAHNRNKESITDKELRQLEMEDFDVNAVERYKKQDRLSIGFIA